MTIRLRGRRLARLVIEELWFAMKSVGWWHAGASEVALKLLESRAIEILQQHLPKHKVIGIDCVELIWGLGAIHCLTQQQPRV